MIATQLWWYTARAGGIVAWALLAAGVLWGLALSTKALGRRPRPNWLLDLHRFLGAAAVMFTAIHVMSILLDSYVHFGPAEVLVPLASSWHPVAVAWGIVGLYLLLAVEITSLLRKRLSKRAWRMTHFLSFPLYVFATVHAFAAGSDSGSVVMRDAAVLVTLAIVGLTALRVIQAVAPRPPTPRGDRPVPARPDFVVTQRAEARAPRELVRPS
jgi:methionine sulfoxide reductase heme-binding subunit